MTHLDLFSGIGGFAIAAQSAGYETIGFCEIDKYATKVLKKHWPNIPNYGDIKNIKGVTCDLITGGFPCQPFSVAGKRRGSKDDRHLWPEMLRVIGESKPAWVIGENVPGIINMELDRVLSDLESIGYSVWPFVIPACAIGSFHRRNRVWIVASNTHYQRREGGVGGMCEVSPDGYASSSSFQRAWSPWSKNSLSSPRICRAVDGIPNRMDRLKGLGNAIVPQVAYELIKMISTISKDKES